MVAGRVGTPLQFQPGGPGPPVRPQRELGVAPAGAGGAASRKRATAGARRPDPAACGHEVSGPVGARQPGRLSVDGRRVRAEPVQQPGSRPDLRRLARCVPKHPAADSGLSGTVSESPAPDHAGTCRRRPAAGSRSGGGHRPPCATAVGPGRTTDEFRRTGAGPRRDRTGRGRTAGVGRAHPAGATRC